MSTSSEQALSSDDHLRELSTAQRAQVDACAQAFEDAWSRGSTPDLAEFLPPPGPLRLPALVELALVDLELRFKAQQPVSSQDFCDRFPELAAEAPAALLAKSEADLRRRALSQNGHSPPRPHSEQTLAGSSGKRFPYRLNCPHCHEPIAVAADRGESDVVCPCCGSTFRLDGDASETWQPERLPLLGKFKLLKLVGRGSFGAVYRARDTELSRIVAVKLPRSGSFSTKEDEERFIREARSAAQMQHPGIVPVYEVGRSELYPYIVSEFVEGLTLSEFLTADRLGLRESAQLVAEVADALDHAHRHGIVHRDLKPSNIMLEPRRDLPGDDEPLATRPRPANRAFRPRLMDFGLARREGEDITLAVEGQPLGTPAYMSPEQARGDGGQADGRSDVYSLGVILYRLLVGELPFRGNARMLVHQVQHEEPIPPRRMNDRIHRDLQTVCLKAMAKNPRHRYATAGHFAADLRRYLAGEAIKARPVGRIERTWRWCLRNRAASGLIASLLVACLALTAAGFVSWQSFRARQLDALQELFDDKLDRLAVSSAYIDEVHGVIDQMRRIDRARAQDRSGRFEARYEDFLLKRIQDAGLTQQTLAEVRSVADVWQHRHPQSARKLQHALARRNDQSELFILAADRSEALRKLGEAFSRGVAVEAAAFRRSAAPANAWKLAASGVPTPGGVEFEVQYADGWQETSSLGLALGCSAGAQQPPQYLLLLRSIAGQTSADDSAATRSFAQAASSQQPLAVEIWRGTRRIKQFELDAGAVGAGPLRFWIKRVGDQFQIQVNQTPQLRFREVFSPPRAAAGTLGIVWPGGVAIERLAAYQFKHLAQSDLVLTGDELLAHGKYADAIDVYLKAEQQSSEPRSQENIRLRRAICLAELGRSEAATQLFAELSASTDEPLAQAAKLRWWYLLVQTRQLEEAHDVFRSLATGDSFAELAAVLPDDVRDRIIEAYRSAVPYTGYVAIRPYPNRVRDFERLQQVLEWLQAPRDQRVFAEWSLMLSYQHDNRLGEALATAERLLAGSDPQTRAGEYYSVLQEYIRSLRRAGRAADALRIVDNVLAQGERPSWLAPLLHVERARIFAATGDSTAAWKEIEEVLDDTRTAEQRAPVARREARMEALLIGGFLQEDLGQPEAGQALWKQGMADARSSEDNPSLYLSLFGSLTGEYSSEDIRKTVSIVVKQSNDSPVLNFLAQSFAPAELVASVMRNMWRTPRGKRYARQLALHQLPYAQQGNIQVLLAANEVWRQAAQNSVELGPPLPEDEDRMLWKMSEDVFAQYSQLTVSEMTIVQLAMTWQGSTGILGWATAARSLQPHCRGPLAYMFGCHYARLNRLDDARRFFQEALQLSEPESDLRRLTKERIAALPPPEAP